MAFTETFGGTTIYPSDVSYRAISLSANQELSWPLEVATSGNVVAQIMDVTPSASGFTITMPPANEASPGETALFFNAGSFNFTVADNAGNTIVTITPGLAYQVYLTTNTTVAGTWRTTQFGAGTSSATAGSLVGAGIKAINTTLNQSMAVTSLSVNYTAGAADRSAAFLWTGGAGTITLPAASTVGNDWFFHIRNGGTGAISLATTGGELINGTATVDFNPGDSAIIVCDGTGYFTIGFGQAPEFLFDYVSIDLTSQSSPYTLSGSNLNRIAYQFSGTLTANMQIIVPATIQQYWVGNFTTGGSYTLTVKTSAGTGVVVPRDARAILYCNGTDVVTADTGGISIPILVSQGGTGATNASQARTNLGATSIGNALFIAVDEATARNAIIAAKSGANSDITSLSGLTTPLSVAQGGTGVATFTANGLVYGAGTSSLSVTAAGTTGQVLVGNTGSAPSWATLSGIGVTSFSAGTTGLTPSSATSGAITLAGTLIVANGGTGATTLTGYVKGSGTSALTASATIPATDISGGAALTKTDDTNVTLTLGGTPASALLAATSLTLGWSGQLSVARGGTGASTLTANGVLYGAGTSAIAATAVGTTGQVLVGNTGAAPSWATLTGIGVTSFSGGTTGLTPNSATTGAITLAGTLGVANGGTGTTTAFTAGSVVFAGASGVYSQDNANLFWDNTNDRLGIGTTSPDNKLEVTVGDNAGINIEQASANQTGFFNFRDADGALAGRISYDHSNNSMRLATNETERVRIDSVGNVGIGTSSPATLLHISATNPEFRLQGTNGTGSVHKIRSTGLNSEALQITSAGDTYYNANLQVFRAANESTEYMRINSSGNVGIGTSSPGAKLDVNGEVRIYPASSPAQMRFGVGGAEKGKLSVDTSSNMAFETAGSERMRINSSGNVGIGVTPSTWTDYTALQVGALGGAALAGTVNNTFLSSNAYYNSGFKYAATGAGATYYQQTSSEHRFFNAPSGTAGNAISFTQAMTLDASGNLGVGTSSPSSKFVVSNGGAAGFEINPIGSASAPALYSYNRSTSAYDILTTLASEVRWQTGSSPSERMRIDSSGNVGIGTSSPATRLHAQSSASNTTVRSTSELSGSLYYSGFEATRSGTAGGALMRSFRSAALGGVGWEWLTTVDNSAELAGTYTSRMVLNNDGNVGIGTSSPTAKLHVAGTIQSSSGSTTAQMYSDGGAAYFTSVGAYPSIFLTNSAERMRITSAGDVGIGYSTLYDKLQVAGSVSSQGGGYFGFYRNGPTNNTGTLDGVTVTQFGISAGVATGRSDASTWLAGFDSLRLVTAGIERMRITSSGDVAIGTTGLAYSFTGRRVLGIDGTDSSLIEMRSGGTQRGYIIGDANTIKVAAAGSNTLQFETNGAERARIASSGNMGVGTTQADSFNTRMVVEQPTSASSAIAAWNSATTGDNLLIQFFTDNGAGRGSITYNRAGGLVAYNVTSDYRAKDIIGPVTDAGATIDALKVYAGKMHGATTVRPMLIAHEAQEVTPYAVTGEKDAVNADGSDKHQQMDHQSLIPLLIAELQSVRARLAQLEGN